MYPEPSCLQLCIHLCHKVRSIFSCHESGTQHTYFLTIEFLKIWKVLFKLQQRSHCAVMKGLAKPEGLLNLSGCGGDLQQQLPDAHGGSKAWPQAPRCPAGSHMPQGYELRAGQLPGQPGPVSR